MEHGKSFLSQGYIRELFLKNGLTILNIVGIYLLIGYLKKCYKFMKVLYNFIVQSMS